MAEEFVKETKPDDNEKGYNVSPDFYLPTSRPLANIAAVADKYLRGVPEIPGFNDVDTMAQSADRMQRNAGQMVLTLPGAFTTITPFAADENGLRLGPIPGAIKDYIFNEEDLSGIDRVIASFFEKGGLSRIEQRYKEIAEAQGEEGLRAFKDSEDGYNLVADNLRPGLSFASRNALWAAKAVGETRRPDEQTYVDALQQILFGAALGGPRTLFTKGIDLATQNITNSVLRKVATGSIKFAEVATPLTMPYTGKNIALNAAVGAGLNEVQRGATGQNSLIAGGDLDKEAIDPSLAENREQSPLSSEALKSAGILGISLSGLGMLGLSYKGGKALVNKVGPNKAGPSIAEQIAARKKDNPAEMTMREKLGNVTDEYRPVTGALRRNVDRQAADEAESLLMETNYVSAHNKAENTWDTGLLPDGTRLSVAPRQLIDTMNALSPEELDAYKWGRWAQQSVFARKEQLRQLEEEVLEYQRMSSKDLKPETLQEAARAYNYLQKVRADLEETRPNLTGKTLDEVKKLASVLQSNPKLAKVARAEQQLYNELGEYRVRAGDFTASQWAKMKARNPHFMHWFEDPNPSGLWGAVKNIGKTDFDERGALYTKGPTRARHFDTRPDPKTGESMLRINQPLNPGDAFRLYLNRAVQRVEQNNGRRQIIDLLEKGGLGSHYTNPNSKQSTFSLAQLQHEKSAERSVAARPTSVPYFMPDGRWKIFEAGTPEIAHVLKMDYQHMGALVESFSKFRKMRQAFTTGIAAPWQSGKNLVWEALMVPTLAHHSRAVGLVQKGLKRLAISLEKQGSKDLAAVVDYMSTIPGLRHIDPTTYALLPFAIARQLAPKIALDASIKIKASMEADSGVLGAIARTPQGKVLLDRAANWMGKAYMDSYLQMWRKSGNQGSSAVNIGLASLKSYKSWMDSGKLSRTAYGAGEYWSATLEAISNSAKFSMFTQNLSLLEAKYGVGKVPQKELRKLATDTRGLTGDFFRKSGNMGVRKTLETVQYGNVYLQSGRTIWSHLYKSIQDQDPRALGNIIAGAVIPAVTTSMLMTNYDTKSYDYWWNRLADWQRMSTLMVPMPKLVEAWSKGQKPEFKPEDYYKIPLAPEFAPWATMVIAGMRAMGALPAAPDAYKKWIQGMQQSPASVQGDLWKAVSSYIGRGVPIYLDAGLRMAGIDASLERAVSSGNLIEQTRPSRNAYQNTNGNIDATSSIPQFMKAAIEGLIGTAGTILVEGANAADKSLRDEKLGYGQAISRFFGTVKHEVQRRTPDIPGLWRGPETLYQRNQQSERLNELKSASSSIQHQLSYEKRGDAVLARMRGLAAPGTVGDPQVRQAMMEWGDFANKLWSTNSATQKERQLLQRELNQLRLSSGRDDAGNLATKRNEVIRKMGDLNQREMRLVDQQLGQMARRYGPYFEQKYKTRFSIESLAKAIQVEKRASGQ